MSRAFHTSAGDLDDRTASLTRAGPMTRDHRRHDVGDWVTLAGAGITLLGALRSLAPLGGWHAAFPAKVHRAAGVVLRLFRRRPPSVTGHAVGTLPTL